MDGDGTSPDATGNVVLRKLLGGGRLRSDRVATSIKYASQADRDAAMSTGSTDGMEMSYKALDGVLAG